MRLDDRVYDFEVWSKKLKNSVLGMQFLLIESAAFAASVLRHWGVRQHYPVGVIARKIEEADEIAKKLGVFRKNFLATDIPPEKFQNSLAVFHDDCCVVLYRKSRYAHENMECLLSQCAGGMEGRECLILIVFLDVIPEEYQDEMALVLDLQFGGLDCIDCGFLKIFRTHLRTAILEQASVLEYEINRHVNKLEDQRKDTCFWSAVTVLVALVYAIDEQHLFNIKSQLEMALKAGLDNADSYEWSEQIPVLFCQAFDDLIPDVCRFQREKEMMKSQSQNSTAAILFDRHSYFIPEGIFLMICDKMGAFCSENQVKAALSKAGILCSQGRARNYWTIKKWLPSQSAYARFVKLNRAILESDQELSFEELFNVRVKKRRGDDAQD